MPHRGKRPGAPAEVLTLTAAIAMVGLAISGGGATGQALAKPPAPAAAPKAVVVEQLLGGTRFETPVHMLDSGAPGPTVLVVAGIHGNEPAPPRAAAKLLRLKLRKGRLVVCATANRPALAAKTRYTPKAKYIDLNRNFPTPDRASPRGELAPAVWGLIARHDVDFVVDLHEGWDFHRQNPKSIGSSVTYVPSAHDGEVVPLARTVIAAVDATVDAPHKRFTLIAPGPLGSLARSATTEADVPSLVFETTRLPQPIELRAAQHELMVRTFLREQGMID